MKIVLWNVRSGGNGKIAELAAALRDQAPDPAVLNEHRTGTSDDLIAELRRHGLDHAVVSPSSESGSSRASCR